MTTEEEVPMMTWRMPAKTPPWSKDFGSMYVNLLGSQTRFVQGKKYRTRVIEAGQGEPLILIHGVGGSAEAFFRNVMPLSKDFHVCAIDALFHGLSSKEPADASMDSTGAQVEHVLDFMDAMGFERAHLCGESMGAHITFRLALEHPERVGRIVLNTGHQVNMKRQDFAPQLKGVDSMALLTRLAVSDPNPANVRARIEWLMTTPDRVIDELVDLRLKFYTIPEARGGIERTGVMNIPRGANNNAPTQAGQVRFEEEDCKKIKAETLVFWTQFNPSNGPDVGEYFASLIPGAKYYCMQDAAHWPQYEHPEEHDAVITKFIKTGQV